MFASNIGLFADKFDDMIFFGFCHLWYLFNPLTSFEHSHVKFVTSSHFARFPLVGQGFPHSSSDEADSSFGDVAKALPKCNDEVDCGEKQDSPRFENIST